MKNFYSIMLACAGLFGAGCSENGPEAPSYPPHIPLTDNEIRISATIDGSRATDYGFEAADCIGVYVVNRTGNTPAALVSSGNHVDNMRFTYNNAWTPDNPIYWSDDHTCADFYAYYPYGPVQSVTAHRFDVRSDQSTEAAYKASDFMAGMTMNVAPQSDDIIIAMTHVMSRVIIYLEPGDGFTAESLAAARVAVRLNGVKCSSTINLSTATATATGSTTSVTPFADTDHYKALIVPQTVAEGNLITVNVDGRDFNLRKGFTFERAKSHKFTITLKKTSNGVGVTITPWEDDGADHGGVAE